MNLKIGLGTNKGIRVGTAGTVSLPTITLPQNLLDTPGAVLEDFETIGDWTVASGAATQDTTYFKSGSKSIKMVTPSGANCQITKNVSLDLSTATEFRIHFFIEDNPSLALNWNIFLSSYTDFSKYFFLNVSATNYHYGWNCIVVKKSAFSNISGDDWARAIVRMRIRYYGQVGQVATGYIDRFYANHTARPAVMIMFDDGHESTYNIAYPYMASRKIRGTAYVITSTIGDAGIVSAAQLQNMNNSGWSIGGHSHTHANLTTLTQGEIETELTTSQGVLDSISLTENSKHTAYPFGAYNSDVLAAMAATGMLTGRIVNIIQPVSIPGDNYTIECQNIVNTTSLATAQGYIDTAIANNAIAALLFHDLVEAPSQATEWSIANFRGLIDYLVTKKSQIFPITISDFYKLNSGSIGIPRVV